LITAVPVPEKSQIARIRRLAQPSRIKHSRPLKLLTGIGDDCAVLRPRPGHDLLVTTDFSLEGIHFRRDWHSPESAGHRCLARGLSDIAAMGGDPIAIFLSLALPPDLPQSWVQRFLRSLIALAEKYGATLAGGDTAASLSGILADIVVLGSVPKGEAILRSTARPGDLIYVSGELGGAAATLRQLQANSNKSKINAAKQNNAKQNKKLDPARHFFPEPRLAVARILRQKALPSAMIDTSDGLSTDLAHICEESGVGAELQAAQIPRAKIGNPPQKVDLQLALHGGEDYELLFTAAAEKKIPRRIAGVSITPIGRITRSKKILLRESNSRLITLKPQGWEHFRKK
jgi:thiamine-monophosphate kinase